MPYGDRTGPQGQGPMTGRAMGYCAGNNRPGFTETGVGFRGGGRFRRGFGIRRGFERGFGFRQRFASVAQETRTIPVIRESTADEKAFLQDELKYLKEEMKEIEERLKQLKTQKTSDK